MFELTKNILKEHPNGFYEALIKGLKGRGKSAYCINTMKQVYIELYGLSVQQAYEMALENIFFDIKDIIAKLKIAKGALRDTSKMVPVITWDDAGVHGSNYLFFTNRHLAQRLKGYHDILRTRCTGFLINSPNVKGLLTFLRDVVDDGAPEINITKKTIDWERVATARAKREGYRRKYKLFIDNFSCYLPKNVYYKYIEMKEEAFEKQEDELEKYLDLHGKFGGLPEKKPIFS